MSLKWHRRLGLTLTPFILLLVITGVLILFSDTLSLSQKKVNSKTLLQFYGFDIPEELPGFKLSDSWISQCGEQLFFNDRPVLHHTEPLKGAVQSDAFLAVASTSTLLLLSPEGDLIERLRKEQLPAKISRLGLHPSSKQLLIESSKQGSVFIADKDVLSWKKAEAIDASWSKAGVIPQALQKKLLRQFTGPGLNLERLLLDLHSGQVFGSFGKIVVALVAFLMFFLVYSGTKTFLVRWLRKMKLKQPRVNGESRIDEIESLQDRIAHLEKENTLLKEKLERAHP